MNFLKLFFSFFLSSFLFYSAQSSIVCEPVDTSKIVKTDTLKIFYLFEKDLFLSDCSKHYVFVDTLLNNAQNFKVRLTGDNFSSAFSNNGLAIRQMIFNSNPKLGFRDEVASFYPYFFQPENIKYFNVSNAFTNVFYMMGTGRQQIFDLLHTQNIKKRWNVAVNYRMIFAPGNYLRQKADDAFLSFSSNYKSKSNRYQVIGNYFFNRIKVQENGGIANDSVFEYDFETNRKLVDINLYYAQNKIVESGFYIKQFFTPVISNRKDTIADSLKKITEPIGFGRFYHSFLLKNQSRIYRDDDPGSGFYPNVLLDTALTLDSTHINKIENTFGWSNLKYNSGKNEQFFIFDVFGKHQITKVFQQISDTSFNSVMAGANILLNSVFGFDLKSNVSRVFSGYGADNSIYSLSVSKIISNDSVVDPFKISGSFTNSVIRPDWFDMHYYSNHFVWDYTFEDINTTLYKADIKNTKYGFCFSYQNINGFVYYDNYARPKQTTQTVEIVQGSAFANLKAGGWHLDQIVNYQKAYGPEIIKLPDLASFHNLYFEHLAFKNALKFQIGASATFLMGDYIMAYMPATRQFYLQDNIEAKPYPFMDFYLNAQIKRAYLFVKLEHFNAGLMGRSYYLTEHYPANDRMFRFGVSWRFFD